MLEISKIKAKDAIKKLAERGFKDEQLIEKLLFLEKQRVEKQLSMNELLEKSNKLAKNIGNLIKNKEFKKAESIKLENQNLKLDIQKAKEIHQSILEQIQTILYQIPNIPNSSVPIGKSENDNKIIFESNNHLSGNSSRKDFIPHWDLIKKYDIIDFETGVTITGNGFPLYKNKGAKLVRGLINFFLDIAQKNKYQEFIPPLVVNDTSARSTGQLPDKEGQMYYIQQDNLYLIPTAEIPLTNIYRNKILKEEELPIKLTAYSPCFRREAGSYGKNVRGLNRLHQFNKVEIVQICKPENSYKILDDMVAHVKYILNQLGLPYRILMLCTGDLGFTSALTYDFEVYSAAQNKWLEVSSVSNFETYQSNRLKCRYKNKLEKKQLVHTLNGSALALPRIIAALLENNQTSKGIKMPKVLQEYLGFDIIN